MLVSGASGHERHGTVGLGSLAADVTEQLDGVARVGPGGRRAPPEVTHAVVAVDVAGVDGSLEQGPLGAAGDRHVGATGGLEDEQRVAHDVVDGRVATDAGDGPQVEGRVEGGEEQGARVVDSGVDVEHDGGGFGRHSGNVPVRAGAPAAAHCGHCSGPRLTTARHPRRRPPRIGSNDAPEPPPTRPPPHPPGGRPRGRRDVRGRLLLAAGARHPLLRRHVVRPDLDHDAPDDACHEASRDERGAATTSTPAPPSSCAPRIVAGMDAGERAGQLLMVGLDHGASRTSLDALVSSRHLGGVILLGGWTGGVDSVRATTRHLAALASKADTAGLGLLLAADQEGGAVQQLRGAGFSRMPSARVQDQGSPGALTADATRWATELRQAGINVNLAPVADTVPTSIGRANGPIGQYDRQFSSDPERVSRMVGAFLAGMRAGGVAATVKHFPGIGRITGNTDVTAQRHHRPHDDRRRPLPRAVPHRRPGRRRARHGRLGDLQPHRPRHQRRLLEGRSSPTCSATGSPTTASSSPTTSAPPGPWPPCPSASAPPASSRPAATSP